MSILWSNDHDQTHPDEITSLMAQRGGHAHDYAPSDRQRLAELAGEVAEVANDMGDWATSGGTRGVLIQQWRLRLLRALREAQR